MHIVSFRLFNVNINFCRSISAFVGQFQVFVSQFQLLQINSLLHYYV